MKERLVVRLRRQANPDGQRRQWLSRRASMRLDRFLMWFDWIQFESVPKFTLGLAAAFVFGISLGILVTAAIVDYSSPPDSIGASVKIASGKQEAETASAKSAADKQVVVRTPEPGRDAADTSAARTPPEARSDGETAPKVSERLPERLPAQTVAPAAEPQETAPLARADRPRKKPPPPKPTAKPEAPKVSEPAVEAPVGKPSAGADVAPIPKPRQPAESAIAEIKPPAAPAQPASPTAEEPTPKKSVAAKPAPEGSVAAKTAPPDQASEETSAPAADTATASEEPVVAAIPPTPEQTETSPAPSEAQQKTKTLQLESAPTVPTDTAPDDAMQQAAGPTRREAAPAKTVAPPRESESIVAAIPSDKAAETVVDPSVAPSLLLPKSTSEGSTIDAVPPTLWQEGGEIEPSLKDRRYKEDRVASLPLRRDLPWIRNAVKTPPLSGDAMIAIVIDDMGIAQKRTRRVIELPAPLTMAFIPYGFNLRELTRWARRVGHEVMVHLPMEPLDPEINPGPNALFKGLPLAEIKRRIEWNLDRFDGYVGVNNHMGSKFTAWPAGMELVMREVQSRGLLFLDSWTNNRSAGLNLAREHKVPNAIRDVFIDHDIARDAIKKRLGELERIARRRGFAIGIGHPHELTRAMLSKWIPAARRRGIDFVPVSAIVRRRMKSG